MSPIPLERYGDSVKFEIKVELPRQMFHKNSNYRLIPEFYFGSQTKVFEAEGLVFEGAKIQPAETPSKRQSFAMRFEDGMELGTLEMYGLAYSNKGWFKKRTRSYVLSRGVKNTPSLTQLGQIYETGNVSRIGVYVPAEGIATYGMFQEGWQPFLSALQSTSGVGYDEKSEIVNIIQGRGDFTLKERLLQDKPYYANLRRDVILAIPNLTSGLTSIQKTPMEISVLAHHIINNNAVPQVLTEQELAHAAVNEPRIVQKNKLYFAMVKGYPSVFSWNNLGVTYLNLYHREVDRGEKLGYLNAARDAFENANAIFQNPFASFNMALITALLGNYLDAYQEFFVSMSLTQSEEIRQLHQAKLGAVSILNGDYRLAAMHLNQSERDQVNLFNRGLAYLMMQDYYNALVSFEDCAVKDIENGYPFYGLALIAARNGELDRFFENIQKAVEKNEYLKQRAVVDPEFLFYRQEERFKEIFR